MATGSSSHSGIEDNQAYTHRCHNLITNVGGMVYRHILNNELDYRGITLENYLKQKEKEINDLTPNQWILNVLFPRDEAAKTDAEFDISAIAFLLRYFFTKEGEKLQIGYHRSGDPKLIDGNTRAWNWSVDGIYPWNTNVIYDIIRIKEYRNKIHHIVNTKTWLSETKFKKLWCDISAALLNLGRIFGIPNMFFEIDKVLHETLDPRITIATGKDNLKECSERKMTLQSNATFVKTRAFESTLKRLQKTGFVVINGNHGEGTSTIALHLISEKRYLRLSTPNDWRLVSIKNCDAIFIDDIFGVAVLEEENVKCWRPVLEEIREAVLKKDIIVLITIKPHILRQAKKYLFYKLSNWFADNVITVKSETISIDERYEILKSHLEANERKIDIDALKTFVSSYENNPETMFQIGFPQRANMYAEFSQFFEKGFTFLEKPIYFVKNCLSDVLSEEKSFSAFFFLWSQPKHTLRITELDDMEERSEIFCRLKQQNVFSVSYVKEALLSHKDGFINYIEDSEEFRFSHDIIADVVGLLVCEKNIKDGINLCSLDFLLTYVTTADETEDESIVKVYIKKSRFELLHKRLLYFYRSNKMAVNHDAFGNENFVSVLKEKEDKEEVKNFEIFHDACTVGAIQTVSCMLNCGIEGHEVKGFSPIHMAADSNHCEIVSLFVKRNPELLKLKISGGENEYQKYQGATVLHIASLNGYETMINILLSLGADVNLRDCEGNTPLLLSIKEEKYRITRIFLKHEDVEINTPDINGSTPLMEAVKNNLNIAKSLLQKQNVDINCINSKNQTALDIALSKGADNIVKRLKTKGAETAK